MAVTFTIEGVDKTSAIDWRSVAIESNATRTASICRFLVKNFGSKTYRPAVNDEVVIEQGADTVFGGLVVQVQETVIGRAKFFRITCRDYSVLLDRQLVSQTYENETAEDIVADIIANFTDDGFTTTAVVAPVLVDRLVFNYLPVSKCIQKIAELIGNYDWYPDYTKDIHFFARTSEAAPFNLDDTGGKFVWNSLDIRETTDQIRNEVVVRGGDAPSATTRTEYFSGTGTRLIFPLASKFATLPTVTVGGVGQTVGIDYLNDDASFQVMWDYNQKSLRFTAGNVPASATDNIIVVGTPLYPIVVVRRDETSIAEFGVFQHFLTDKNLGNIDAANLRARAELAKYSQPSQNGKFRTYENGLVAGQVISIESTIRGIDGDFKINSVKSKMRSPDEFEHEAEVTTAEDIGILDIFNQLLIQNPNDSLDVSQNEVIQKFYSFEETAGVADAATAAGVADTYYWETTALSDTRWGFFTWG